MNAVGSLAPEAEAVTISSADASLGTALSELTKARLTVMVLLTTLTGYFLANRGALDWLKVLNTLAGTALVAVCASILNQALERRTDALMRRTQGRPFVTRRLPVTRTVIAGLILGAAGLAELYFFVNGWATLLALITLVTYIVIYTPMKRLTILNTLVGAIPGALPPLLGAVAARGSFSAEGWTLFAILGCWQLPHFYAIAWLYREDYRAAGLKMVSVADAFGRQTGIHAVVSAGVLFWVSLLPSWLAGAGRFYGAAAPTLSAFFFLQAWRFARHPDRGTARSLFLGSIVYLPLILLALVVDKMIRP